MNLISGKITDGGVQIGDYLMPLERETLAKAAGEENLVLGIRPENFAVAPTGISVDVDVVEETGADGFIYGTLAGLSVDEKLNAQQIVARTAGKAAPTRGTTIKLNLADPAAVHIFSEKTQERLN